MRYFLNRDTGEILNEYEAAKEWIEDYDGNDPTNIINFFDQYEEVSGTPAAILADIDRIIKTSEPADKYKYMLLDRLRSDCGYYLGYGNRNAAQLWAGCIETHIEAMRRLYYSFPEEDRPEWITAEGLEALAAEMRTSKEPTERKEAAQ